MILKNKKRLLLTSLATLLPIPAGLVLMDRFPDTMAIHFGFSGQADGFASPNFAVFVPPMIMLAVQWLCVLGASLDKGNRDKNKKIQSLVLWIIPLMSNISMMGIYALALGLEFSPVGWTMVFMGILFAVLGNYMPKTRMNATIGIKIPTTYSSQENWNATHRLAGKLWVIGGIAIAALWWLPHVWALVAMFGILTAITMIPILFSLNFYRKEKAEGKELSRYTQKMDPKMRKFGIGFALILTAVLVVTLFFGDIRYDFREDHLLVDANMYTDYTLRYDAIEAVEYREGNVSGLRVGGFGSFRLLMGWFENEEFGTHIRYTYYQPEACVIVRTESKTVVLSGADRTETLELYNRLLEKCF